MNSFLSRWVWSQETVHYRCLRTGTDRIAAGEYPKDVPPRPQGVERNIVSNRNGIRGKFSQGILSRPHRESDRRNPTVNPNGMLYGTHEEANDLITYLDPNRNTTGEIPIPVTDGTPFAGTARCFGIFTLLGRRGYLE